MQLFFNAEKEALKSANIAIKLRIEDLLNQSAMQRIKMRLSSVTRNLSKFIDLKSMKILDNYAQYNPSPLTMQQMLEFGQTATEVESYQFLRREVPVRLSNIMKEVNLLPSSLLQMPSILLLQVNFVHDLKRYVDYVILKRFL